MNDIDLTKNFVEISLLQKDATDLTFSVLEANDCCAATEKDLTGVIPYFFAYDKGATLVLQKEGAISGEGNNVITFAFTETDLTLYPSVYYFNILFDTELYITGKLKIVENANFIVSYPNVIS